MSKTHSIKGVVYKILQQEGAHTHLEIEVKGEKHNFWYNTETNKKEKRAGRGFKPGRGAIPGQSRGKAEAAPKKPSKKSTKTVETTEKPPQMKIAGMKTLGTVTEMTRAGNGTSAIENIVTKAYSEKFAVGRGSVRTAAFALLGETLGMSKEFLAGLAAAEGVVLPSVVPAQSPAPESPAQPATPN